MTRSLRVRFSNTAGLGNHSSSNIPSRAEVPVERLENRLLQALEVGEHGTIADAEGGFVEERKIHLRELVREEIDPEEEIILTGPDVLRQRARVRKDDERPTYAELGEHRGRALAICRILWPLDEQG